MKSTKSNSGAISYWVLFTSALALSILGGSGCDSQTEVTTITTKNIDLIDESVTQFHNLGWVGIRSYPLSANLSFESPDAPDQSVSPGGLVVAQVIASTPAEKAGFKKNDIIVGIEDKWVPIKDDPTLDVMSQLETRITSAETQSIFKIYRDGAIVELTVDNVQDSLDGGLPDEVTRLKDAAQKGLNHLVTLQNEDGSFGLEEHSLDSKLQISAVAGLALLSMTDETFQTAGDKCTNYIGQQLDQLASTELDSSESETVTSDDPQSAASIKATMIKMPEFDLHPLTAAYVAQFLSEADVSLLDRKWMGRLIGLAGALNRAQAESGAWCSTETLDQEAVDIQATYVTNQCLLAIGMLERIGVSANPDTVKNACRFLTSQITARAGSAIDRRVKAALTAGTGTALYAINCQPSDTILEQTIEDGLEWASEMHLSPSLNLSGLLSVAILAKQAGDGPWARFYENAKLYLATATSPDGQFIPIPGGGRKPLELEIHQDNAAWQTAHYSLLLALQSGQLKSLIGQKKSSMMITRNSAGEASKGSTNRPGMPAGMPGNRKTMSLTLEDLDGEGSLEDRIKEKLKEMGVDTSNIQMSTTIPGKNSSEKKKETP